MILLLACGGAGPAAPIPGAADGGSGDSGVIGDAGLADGGGTDAGHPDGGVPDGGGSDGGSPDGGATTPTLPGRRATLLDGTVVEGEPIAAYDQRLWWHPAEEQTTALFDPAGWALYPDDTSLRFVPSSQVRAWEELDLGAAPGWRDWLSSRGLLVERLPLDEEALVIMGNEGYHLDEDGYGDFAWDLVLTDAEGRRFTGSGAANADYRIWGAPVRSPVSGLVVEVVRDAPDNLPGAWPEGAENNLVGIWLQGQLYLYLLHFQQGSVPPAITPGAWVSVGDLLGRVGNSGVSLEPHLHLTALYYDLHPLTGGGVRTWSVPIAWAGQWVSTSPGGPGDWTEDFLPATGTWLRDDE